MSEQLITSTLLDEEPDLVDLIDKFISRLPAMRDNIIKTYSDNDIDTFTKLVHQMKGVGGNYGYPVLSELCAEIEVAVKEEISEVKKLLDEFQEISEKILAGQEENHKIAQAKS